MKIGTVAIGLTLGFITGAIIRKYSFSDHETFTIMITIAGMSAGFSYQQSKM